MRISLNNHRSCRALPPTVAPLFPGFLGEPYGHRAGRVPPQYHTTLRATQPQNTTQTNIMKTTISLAAISALSLATATAAVYHVDSWTAAGGAFVATNQPDYIPNTGGTLYSDTAIADSTNSVTDNTGATIDVTGADSGGLYGEFFYNFNSTSTAFSANLKTMSSDLETLRIEFKGGGLTPITADTFTISYGGQTFSTAASFTEGAAESTPFGPVTPYILTYDVSSASAGVGDSFTVGWNFPNAHTAIVDFSVTQVPEPSSSLLMGLGAACLILRRRL